MNDVIGDSSMPRPRVWHIFFISFFVLSLELAFIRMIPAEIRAISYFTNLLLFSSFFGLGLGCILSTARPRTWCLPVGTFLLFLLVAASRGIVIYDTGGAIHYWLQQSDQRYQPFIQLPLFVAAILVFVLASVPFVGMGQTLARTMDAFPRLRAYSWDIAGSLAGTVVFAICAYAGLPPWVWICLTLAAWAVLLVPSRAQWLPYFMAGACFLLFSLGHYSWRWSPYYFIQYTLSPNNMTVWVNSSFHQEAINFGSADPGYARLAEHMLRKFSVPYEVYRQHHGGAPPQKVLILGAGTGNDVNVALSNGVKDITAVEIDPTIAALGKALHPLKPYDHPSVRLRIDDGRHFLWNTPEKYDLIVFGTLDSQTLLSGQANLRLENYIYTVESFKDVRATLEDGGLVATYYSVFKPWFLGRIYATLREAFPGEVEVVRFQDNYLFNTILIAGKGVPTLKSSAENERAVEGVAPSTDDWPYIYLERRTISPLYLSVFASVGVLIVGAFVLLKRLHHGEGRFENFFFLGLGFTLLQAAAIVRLALVFGATWMVSAIVFSSTLLMIFLANLAVHRDRAPSLNASWAGLVGSLLLNVWFPVSWLFSAALPLRVLGAAVLIGTPVYFAGTCFSRLFSEQRQTGFPLGINLVGAMAGGLIEYLSMVVGMRSIWLIIVAVYLMAYLTTAGSVRVKRGSADASVAGSGV